MKRARLALLGWLAVAPVRADGRPLTALASSPDALHRANTEALEHRLARGLRSLPGVERADVQLTLPAPERQPLDAPRARPRATVVLTRQTGASLAGETFQILRGALPALDQAGLTLIERTAPMPPPHEELVQVGPFRVHPSSAFAVRVCFGISLGSNVLLATLLLWRGLPGRLRRQPPQRKVDRTAQPPIPP